MTVRTYIVNAFAEDFGCGNPAGVVLYSGKLPETKMQLIAFDINKSETAFVRQSADGEGYDIRWLSPLKEVPLCGHATLAASKVLYEISAYDTITFDYHGGSIKVMHRPDDSFAMDFPLDEVLSIEPEPAFSAFFPGVTIQECMLGQKTKKVIIRIGDDLDIARIQPDFSVMRRYAGVGDRGIGITKRATDYDFESRYFNPWFGVDEDPVTGSVHTALARYWSRILNKNEFRAHQASHRPGDLELHIEDDIVRIAGKAKIVLEGTMNLG